MPFTEAERAKRYREKHREKVRERYNLRKKHQRELLKTSNLEAYKESLKSQRIATAIYRQKKIKEAKEKAIIHSEPSHSQSSLLSFFSPFYKGSMSKKSCICFAKISWEKGGDCEKFGEIIQT